jgi:uncharacterized protein YceH (UPF0502 family)
VDLDPAEVRVLGCLIEKQRVTPDAYPLTLNALRLACNQMTARDPVVQYDEETIRAALHRLSRRRWTRLASGHSSRAAKYRHLLDDALGLDPGAMAVLAVLMLRGVQTPGELKQRTDRMHAFASLDAVQETLERLIGRELAERLPRRPGQKEERYGHTLSDELDEPAPDSGAAVSPPARTAAPAPPPAAAPPREPAAPAPPAGVPDRRVDRLEHEVADLREELAAVRDGLSTVSEELARLREELGA